MKALFTSLTALLFASLGLTSCGGGGIGQQGSSFAAAPAAGTVTIAEPQNGATVGSPVHFVISALSSSPIAGLDLYVDGQLGFQSQSNRIDTSMPLATGAHSIVARARNTNNASFQNSVSISVESDSTSADPPGSSDSASGPEIPADAKVFSNIDQMPGWVVCTVCAGRNANGPPAKYSMKQNVALPSIDGRSAQFWLGGSIPYSAAIWGKQLGGNNDVRHFVYDLYYDIKNPDASQALEFDVNQSTGAKKYIFGTQCDLKGHGRQWDVWDTANAKWVHTGVHCSFPKANTWHHLIWEFEHTDDSHTHFIAFTLDGKRHNVDKYFRPKPINSYELNVAFQMDGDYTQHDYNVWLDRVKLSVW